MKQAKKTPVDSATSMRSFEEYELRFFPDSFKQKSIQKDPEKASLKLIDEELRKLHLLLQAIN